VRTANPAGGLGREKVLRICFTIRAGTEELGSGVAQALSRARILASACLLVGRKSDHTW